MISFFPDVDPDELVSGFTECNEADLYAQTGMIQDRELTPDEQRIAQERYLEEINKRNISYSQKFLHGYYKKILEERQPHSTH